ncbi:hypothetical protein MMC20_002601 [Loxospora ochrophaea]|nr:hypothetical protein [Loxospora ochrophaea]
MNPYNWDASDDVTQELTRVILGLQVFAVAVGLPRKYLKRHWKSLLMMLGPVMTFSWLITALIIHLVLRTTAFDALVISACLAPTDPVLSASVLAESRFSNRVPKRLRDLLSVESGSNDGVSFPFLYIGLFAIVQSSAGAAIRDWFLITILWQCLFGTFLGIFIGVAANRLLRFSVRKDYVTSSSFLVFYFLLALLSVGLGSVLGSDDFLISFGAGIGFSWDGWFASRTHETALPDVLDLLLNSTMFVYFGAAMPWREFGPRSITPNITPARLVIVLILILVFRRIPILIALKRWIPDIKTYREALFCGHFGPMGLGGLFLAIEARAFLETGTPLPLPHPPDDSSNLVSIELVWPVVCFVVLGSIMVHGLSVATISVGGHFVRKEGERAPLIGAESDPLTGMVFQGGGGESDSGSSDNE